MEKIGEGGEAEVFALDGDRVLRRFRRAHPSIDARARLMAEIARGAGRLDVAVPELLDDFVDDDGRRCFVERRLPGRSMTEALASVTGAQRTALLESYLETASTLRAIDIPRDRHGELIADRPVRAPTWVGYLHAALDRRVAATEPATYPGLDIEAIADRLRPEIDRIPEPEPSIVHFDYFPGNVLCDDTRITAVIDWSIFSIVGDPDLDLVMAVEYFGVTPTATDDDAVFGRRWLTERGLADRAEVYQRWTALWWAPVVEDPQIPPWVRTTLTQPGWGPEP